MKFKMTNNGVDTYTSALKKRLSYIRSQLAEEMMNNLQKYTPVRTGNLVSSYEVVTKPGEIQITNDAGYCKYVNDGTRYQAGQHFIEKSFYEAKEKVNQITKKSQNIS